MSQTDDFTAHQTPPRRTALKSLAIGAAAAGAFTLAKSSQAAAESKPDNDVAILNFALNLEYLEAEFYYYAVYGFGLGTADSEGAGGSPGLVYGGSKVPFQSSAVRAYAAEIANDELHHVRFLRAALGSAAVARPAINLRGSFTTLARSAGIIQSYEVFDPFADDNAFLLGSFIFEDVGVTAYNGAAAAFTNPNYLTAATSILAVEAYHAAAIRLLLLQKGLSSPANGISALRAKLSAAVIAGAGDDEGILVNGNPTIVPTDSDSLAYARTAQQVLNIVYGGGTASDYLFYPNRMNGTIS